ncbi:hypothetical protein LA080_011882 [Diaporthe eres]|nr:hypothetical protein LA080_011882 [Diaporthe eres]
MAPKRVKHDQGGALSAPKRDIFPFMSLPAEIRIQIYKIATSNSISVVTHLTIGVKRLFCSQHTILCGYPGELLRWMRWRSQRASRYRWNMSHLTMIEGSRKWPSNPCGIDFWPLNPPPESKDTAEHAEALAEEFPMIKGLRRLKLVISERRGPVFLERLSKRFEAHGIDVEVTYYVFRPIELTLRRGHLPIFSRDGGAGILLLGQRSHLRDQQRSGGIKIGWRYKVCGQEVTQMAWLKKASCDPSSYSH